MRSLPIAALLLSCSSPELTVHTVPELAGPTHEAIAAWNAGLLLACPDVRLIPTRDPDADVRIRLGDATAEHGAYHEGGRIVVDLDALPWDQVAPAIAHELGHALGVDAESDDPDDLMFGKVRRSRSVVPTSADVARVCAAWGAS